MNRFKLPRPFLLLLVLLLAACTLAEDEIQATIQARAVAAVSGTLEHTQPNTPYPTTTPYPTAGGLPPQEPLSTFTPYPTATAYPTSTPYPTLAPSPTPTATATANATAIAAISASQAAAPQPSQPDAMIEQLLAALSDLQSFAGVINETLQNNQLDCPQTNALFSALSNFPAVDVSAMPLEEQNAYTAVRDKLAEITATDTALYDLYDYCTTQLAANPAGTTFPAPNHLTLIRSGGLIRTTEDLFQSVLQPLGLA